MKLRSLGILAAAVAAMVIGVNATKADSIDPATKITVTGTPGAWVYTFNMLITSNSSFTTNDEFTYFDIAGLTGGIAPAGWAVSIVNQANSGNSPHLTPLGLPQPNDQAGAGKDNIVFTWGGGTVAGPQGIGQFSFLTNTLTALGDQTVVNGAGSYLNDATGNLQQANTFSNLVAVPVPAAAWTGLSTLAGMVGIGAIRRRRNA